VVRRPVVGILEPWAWWAGALLLASSDQWVHTFPFFGLLRGPFAWALAALAAGVSVARLPKGRLSVRAPGPALLMLLTFVVSATVGVRYVGRLTASGDEPHYLLMAQSLWRDGDLDLRDDVERQEYREYFPGTLAPHWGAPRLDGRPFPAHSPGLPVLLAPVYALGGRTACVLLFAVLAAALVREVHVLALRATAEARAASFAALVAMGPPVFAYSFHLYTELPSALAGAWAFRILMGDPSATGAALAAFVVSTLPWLHLKMIPAAAALGIVALARLRGRPLAAFVTVAGLSAFGFLAYYQRIFGAPTPLALYGGGVPPDSATSPFQAAAGLLLDRSFGLLPYAPAFLLALPGLVALGRGERRHAISLAFVSLAILAPVLRWRMWWGGQCPPARFLVPLVPFLAVAVAARIAGPARGLARWRWGLFAAGVVLALFMAARPESLLMLNRGDRPTRVWSALSGETPLGRYWPSLVADQLADRRVAWVWAATLGLLLGLDAMARRREGIDRLFRTVAFPVGLALAIGLGVDMWARPTRPPSGENHLDVLRPQCGDEVGRHAGIRNQLVDGVQLRDDGEAAPMELGGVGDDHDLA
jgi:hypothetical protein